MNLNNKIFISHSSEDEYFVQSLVELLEFLGLNNDNIICTSVEGYGIPLGRNIFDYLRDQFIDYNLFVIFVHSRNFYSSHVCMNEMGAAWVLKKDYCSFLTLGFDFKDLSGVVDDKRISIKVDNKMASTLLNEFKDNIVSMFGLPQPNLIIWENKRNKFLETVNNKYILKLESEKSSTTELSLKANLIARLLRTERSNTGFLHIINIGESSAFNVKLYIHTGKDFFTTFEAMTSEINPNGGNWSVIIIPTNNECPPDFSIQLEYDDNFKCGNIITREVHFGDFFVEKQYREDNLPF